jgi:hypothetical protein
VPASSKGLAGYNFITYFCIRMAERVIRGKQEYIAEKWNEYFNKGK